MEISDLIWKLVLLFLPGIVATFIIDALVHIRQKAQFRYGIYALLNGLGVYVLLELFNWLIYYPTSGPQLAIWTDLANPTSNTVTGSEVVCSAILAVPYGFLVSALSRKNVLHRFAAWCHASDKFGDNTVWEHLLSSSDTEWVTVRDSKRGLAYQGRIHKYSDGTSEFELCLSEVKVYRNSDMRYYYYLDYIYLTGNRADWLIEFNYPRVVKDENTTTTHP